MAGRPPKNMIIFDLDQTIDALIEIRGLMIAVFSNPHTGVPPEE